ncbi:4-oxalocrotonate tautomerase, Xylose transport system permease protein xylH [Lactococcus cremoris subsp. cremoris A76]|uniref:2-hydroxymuconate tautomerase n=1 Tax=Lactococcus lactis subsp. cremoris TaxID=1359 RepID=UPI000238CDE9|nr:2-hydroxymuconate tautomerase [Lactococcus cremoris]AEU41205.1 4-oxalocrotonate tautomerase, Xylose transport system permease protein xylH [Lactococcus cremoris subsp. cremoris A76]
MPYVHVELFEGRTVEQKAAIAKEITETISKHAGAPTSGIHVIFYDLPEGMLYQGGEMKKKK